MELQAVIIAILMCSISMVQVNGIRLQPKHGENATAVAEIQHYKPFAGVGDYFMYGVGSTTLLLIMICCLGSRVCSMRNERRNNLRFRRAQHSDSLPKQFVLTTHPPSYISARPPEYSPTAPSYNIEHSKKRQNHGIFHQVIVETLTTQPSYNTHQITHQEHHPQQNRRQTNPLQLNAQALSVSLLHSTYQRQSSRNDNGLGQLILNQRHENHQSFTVHQQNTEPLQCSTPIPSNCISITVNPVDGINNDDVTNSTVTDTTCLNTVTELNGNDTGVVEAVASSCGTDSGLDTYRFVSEPGMHPEIEVGNPPRYSECITDLAMVHEPRR